MRSARCPWNRLRPHATLDGPVTDVAAVVWAGGRFAPRPAVRLAVSAGGTAGTGPPHVSATSDARGPRAIRPAAYLVDSRRWHPLTPDLAALRCARPDPVPEPRPSDVPTLPSISFAPRRDSPSRSLECCRRRSAPYVPEVVAGLGAPARRDGGRRRGRCRAHRRSRRGGRGRLHADRRAAPGRARPRVPRRRRRVRGCATPTNGRVLHRERGSSIRFAIASPGAPVSETNSVSVVVGANAADIPPLHTLADQLTEMLRKKLPDVQLDLATRDRASPAHPGSGYAFRDPQPVARDPHRAVRRPDRERTSAHGDGDGPRAADRRRPRRSWATSSRSLRSGKPGRSRLSDGDS